MLSKLAEALGWSLDFFPSFIKVICFFFFEDRYFCYLIWLRRCFQSLPSALMLIVIAIPISRYVLVYLFHAEGTELEILWSEQDFINSIDEEFCMLNQLSLPFSALSSIIPQLPACLGYLHYFCYPLLDKNLLLNLKKLPRSALSEASIFTTAF